MEVLYSIVLMCVYVTAVDSDCVIHIDGDDDTDGVTQSVPLTDDEMNVMEDNTDDVPVRCLTLLPLV